ncbi:MAG: aldo/keto reductase, partial [Desulfosarcina sp.]
MNRLSLNDEHERKVDMQRRKLGHTDLDVSPLAFGGNVFGWTVDERMSFKLLDAFVDAGFNLIDTADVYSHWAPGNPGGVSETIIGKWLQQGGRRDKVILATKVGSQMSPDRKGLSRSYILQAVEDSLRRLKSDYIDLYQSHVDDEQTPLEETLAAYDQLIGEGKVRTIGASNHTADRLAQALEVSRQHGYPSYQSLQPLYNLYDRADFEKDLAAFCRKQDIGVISFFSLASGFLTGKYRSAEDLAGRSRADMVKKYLDDRGMRILEALDEVADQHDLTPATVALAWLVAQPVVTAPIASATSLTQLHELVKATTVNLDDSAMDLLNEASRSVDQNQP